MATTQIFIFVNIVGGILVLGSYLVGLINYPDLRMNLWGGIEGGWRTIFSISMIPAAVGYLLFCYFMVFKSGLDGFNYDVMLLRHLPGILCTVFLISASIWMPATLLHLNDNGVIWWNIAVICLWVTSISLFLLTASLVFIYVGGQTISRIIGTVGLMYITFHCTVFDAIIWIVRFHKVP